MPSDPHVVKESEGEDQRHGHSDRSGDLLADRSGAQPDAAGGDTCCVGPFDDAAGHSGGVADRTRAVAGHPGAVAGGTASRNGGAARLVVRFLRRS